MELGSWVGKRVEWIGHDVQGTVQGKAGNYLRVKWDHEVEKPYDDLIHIDRIKILN